MGLKRGSRVSRIRLSGLNTIGGVERSPSNSGALSELAWRDDLTGAWNRRYLRRLLAEQWPELVAKHGTVTLLVLDLDGFKQVNDSFGHAAGDRVLRWAAEELKRGFREGDTLIRYGGDEFVIPLPGISSEEAHAMAERARSGFDSVSIDPSAGGEPVTVPISFSLGIASAPRDGERGEDVLGVADRRLYEEKRARRGTAAPSAAPRGRLRWVVAALLALAAVAVATTLAVREVQRPPELPAASVQVPEIEGPGAIDAMNEIVVRDEQELAALRAEVEQLRSALASERAGNDRAPSESRIRELEAQLARADREAAVTPQPVAGTDVESSTGMRVGERRTREELLAQEPAGENLESGQGMTSPLVPPPVIEPTSGAPAAVVAPRLVQAPRVSYPPLARSRRRTAVVELKLSIDATGRVIAAEPAGAPAGMGFDEAAKQAGFSARFAPGTRDGVPVAMETRLSIRFQLD